MADAIFDRATAIFFCGVTLPTTSTMSTAVAKVIGALVMLGLVSQEEEACEQGHRQHEQGNQVFPCARRLKSGEVDDDDGEHEAGHAESDGELIGVLDLDSPKLARFDEQDREGLEKYVAALLAAT